MKGRGAEVALDLYLNLVEQEHGTIQFLGLPQLKDNPNARSIACTSSRP